MQGDTKGYKGIQGDARGYKKSSLRTCHFRYRADPLLGNRDRMELGDVKEYLSPEMGLIQLRHTGRTVLFHLNQVWSFCSNTDDQSEASSLTGRPIREVMEASELAELLPLSTGVRVSCRQLPASPQSPLRSQAMMVTSTEQRDEEGGPEEFIGMFSSHEGRVELVEELNELHEL